MRLKRAALALTIAIAFGGGSAVASSAIKGGPPPVKTGTYKFVVVDQNGPNCGCANRGTVTVTDATGYVVSVQTFSDKLGEDRRAGARAGADAASDATR